LQERLGIAGSGTIATGLAAAAAAHGEVVLWARSEVSGQRARARLGKACDDAVARRVHVTVDPAELASATFLVEAVVEDAAAKASVLGELSAQAGDDALLATTTSSLSVAELGRGTGLPERFLGLHVFNPVPRMELVELVFPDEAHEQTRARARALCEALGKTAIEVPDLPGFVVNRLLFPFLFSAVDLLEETGLEPRDVDACLMLGAGHPMGPLRLLDFVGLDVAQAIGESIDAPIPARLRALVDEGALGRKSGRGFHSYDG
jgi:3-hydroxybutyryl-CoA dehydrogenase